MKNDLLNAKHWKQLEELHDALDHFYAATLQAEGDYARLHDYIPLMEGLLDSIYHAKCRFEELHNEDGTSSYAFLATCAEAAWQKCETYYNTMDQTPFLYVALLLNPTMKTDWFKQFWLSHPDKMKWAKDGEDYAKNIYRTEYKHLTTLQQDLRPPRHGSGDNETVDFFRHYKRLRFDSTDIRDHDAFDEYLRKDTISRGKEEYFDTLRYWYEVRNREPSLARLAFDTLSIPLMSAKCESSFSSAKILITDRRNRLRADIIEANEFLRDAYNNEAKGEDNTLDGEENEAQVYEKLKKGLQKQKQSNMGDNSDSDNNNSDSEVTV